MPSAVGERVGAALGVSSVEDARIQHELARAAWVLTALEVESSTRMVMGWTVA